MGTISIHGLSPEPEKALKEKAKENNQSISSFIKDLIERSIIKKAKRIKNRKHFEKFLNSWSKAEYEEFNKAISDFEKKIEQLSTYNFQLSLILDF